MVREPQGTHMILVDISELYLVGAIERGVPNKERIVLRVAEAVNLGQFGVLLGVRVAPGLAVPIKDNFFWFGDGMVAQGDWLFIYTGLGKPQVANVPNSPERIFTLYWGRKQVILQNENIVPILVRLDAAVVEQTNLKVPEHAHGANPAY